MSEGGTRVQSETTRTLMEMGIWPEARAGMNSGARPPGRGSSLPRQHVAPPTRRSQLARSRIALLLIAFGLTLLLPLATQVAAQADAQDAATADTGLAAETTAITANGWTAPGSEIVVARAFDPPAQPWLSGHRGVDLDVQIGSEIKAAGSGTVVYAGNLAGRPVISIEHASGIRTTYEPVEPRVSKGDSVEAGEVIGTLVEGHSPGSLHWGAKISDDEYMNPLLLISGAVRLKPWDQ